MSTPPVEGRRVEVDGRRFTAPDRPPGTAPIGVYHETDELVWAEYSGGNVVAGRIVGRRTDDGSLDLAYGQLSRDGVVVAGRVVSVPTLLPDGRVRIEERWRRDDGSEGVSVIEELPGDADRPAEAQGEAP